ncbi:MAG: HEAT repeat domain-containing protein [Planctomycetota bacterium]
MRLHLSALLALVLAIPAFAGGNRPVPLPPPEPNLPEGVGPAINAARKLYDTEDDVQRCAAVKLFVEVLDKSADLYLQMVAHDDSHPNVRLTAINGLFSREHPKAPLFAARLCTSSAPKKYLNAGAHLVWKSKSKDAVANLIEGMRKGIAGFEPEHRVGADAGAQTWSKILVRALCIRALGRVATQEAVDALIEALHYPEWELRTAAAEALGQAGDGAGVPHLLKAVDDKDLDVQCESMLALGRIGGAEATACLQKASKREADPRDTHLEITYWRNEIFVRIAKRALAQSIAQRNAAPPAPPAPPKPQPGKKPAAGPGGSDTTVQEPDRPAETQEPVEEERKAPPPYERDEAGEDLAYICDTTLTMTDAKECIKKLVEERFMYRDLASDFRFSFIAFRDYGQQYLTDVLFFTRDIEKVRDYMMHLGFSGGNAGEGSAAEKALQVSLMLDWSRVPRKRMVLITDTYPNDEKDLYFRGRFIHDDENIVINCLYHTHAATKKVILQNLAKIGGGHSDFLPCDKPAGRPKEGAEVR